MKKKKKEKTPMEKLTVGYEEFIKGKEFNTKGSTVFENTLKKAVKPNAPK